MKNEERHVRELYDSAAKNYLELIKQTNYVGPDWLLRNLPPNIHLTDLKLLDLGCGNGVNLENLLAVNPTIIATGLDISPKMIDAARQTGDYKTVHCQSLDDGLGFSTAQDYDLVIALGCLEFVNNINDCLAEIARVCKPMGYFISTFQEYEAGNPDAPRHMHSGDVIHFAYSTNEVSTELADAGFQVLSCETMIGYSGGTACPYIFTISQRQVPVDA